MTITMEQIKAIYAAQDVDMSECDFEVMLTQCNDQEGINGRTAEDWAYFFARQEGVEQCAEESALRQFHHDAYGDD